MQYLLSLNHCVKSYEHLCQIYQNHSPNMVISCDLASNSENFYFSSNYVLNFRKSYQFGGNWLKNKKLQAKNKLGGVSTPPPPPSVYWVKACFDISMEKCCKVYHGPFYTLHSLDHCLIKHLRYQICQT